MSWKHKAVVILIVDVVEANSVLEGHTSAALAELQPPFSAPSLF
jgi:hypothetical protein